MSLSAEVINRAKELYAKLSAVNYMGLTPKDQRKAVLDVYDEVTDSLGMLPPEIQGLYYEILPKHITKIRGGDDAYTDYVREKLVDMLTVVSESEPAPDIAPRPPAPKGGTRAPFQTPYPVMPRPPPIIPPVPKPPTKGGRSISKKFDKCVKSVRRTVKPRRGSTKESAAIAICTTTILHPRKRTLKKYRKGRLVTQRRKAF